MNEDTLISWVFLSTAIVCEQEPANFDSISQIADGINHALPTQKELQTSLRWLMKNGLIENSSKKYQLTIEGKEAISNAKNRTNNIILNIWHELTEEIKLTKAQQGL